jgi:hypothetical protein
MVRELRKATDAPGLTLVLVWRLDWAHVSRAPRPRFTAPGVDRSKHLAMIRALQKRVPEGLCSLPSRRNAALSLIQGVAADLCRGCARC